MEWREGWKESQRVNTGEVTAALSDCGTGIGTERLWDEHEDLSLRLNYLGGKRKEKENEKGVCD